LQPGDETSLSLLAKGCLHGRLKALVELPHGAGYRSLWHLFIVVVFNVGQFLRGSGSGPGTKRRAETQIRYMAW